MDWGGGTCVYTYTCIHVYHNLCWERTHRGDGDPGLDHLPRHSDLTPDAVVISTVSEGDHRRVPRLVRELLTPRVEPLEGRCLTSRCLRLVHEHARYYTEYVFLL